ncbi:MAG: HNH endonuclease signature motif containing protein [Caldilineaceae bacterium]
MSKQYISPKLRQQIALQSRYRCGYCLTSQLIVGPLLEIDHIIPESRGGSSEEDNLVLACPVCNSHKGVQIDAVDPITQTRVRLYNPRAEAWPEHFHWLDQGAVIEGKTAIGRATVIALDMNHPDTVAARHLWIVAGWHPPDD